MSDQDEPGGSRADPGERLAAWLEGLGLAEHLAAAGLPTMERAADGRARWTDPRTGAPLDAGQLADLERLLRSEGSDPAHAVPVPLVQVARRAEERTDLLASPWFDYDALARLRGASVAATRFAVHKAANARALLVVADGARTLVPAFGLTASGEPRADLAPVLEPLLAAGIDPWHAWSWLTRPAALLSGAVPERAAADPEEADLVLHAAVRLAERLRASARRAPPT